MGRRKRSPSIHHHLKSKALINGKNRKLRRSCRNHQRQSISKQSSSRLIKPNNQMISLEETELIYIQIYSGPFRNPRDLPNLSLSTSPSSVPPLTTLQLRRETVTSKLSSTTVLAHEPPHLPPLKVQ
ncbi:Uncharacterized protein Rs2_37214 [Raphanus sativus]|nr:Uncharacterized protein Rs2_37214 [Raphanus sativus]